MAISVKERKDFVLNLEVCETHDHSDAFPQLVINVSSTILRSLAIMVYALVLHPILYTSLVITSHTYKFKKTTINNSTYEPACQYN